MGIRALSSAPAFAAAVFIAHATAVPIAAQVAGTAGLAAASAPTPLGPFLVQGDAAVNRIGSSIAPRTTLNLESTITLPIGRSGVWLGASALQAREIDTLPARPLLEAGVWRSFSDITVRIGASSHVARLGGRASGERRTPETLVSDTGQSIQIVTTIDSGAPSRVQYWSDLEAGASWSTGRIRLDAAIGARPAVDSYTRATWGRLTGTMALSSYSMLVATVGTQPALLALGVPSSRFAALSLSIAPPRRRPPPDEAVHAALVAPAFSVRTTGAGACAVVYHLANAHRVEVSGDFDRWTPVDLVETQPGVWTAALSMAPGTYRMNVRAGRRSVERAAGDDPRSTTSSTARSASSSFGDARVFVVTPPPPRGYHDVEMTDAELARRAKAGDAASFAMLVDRHAGACLRYATRMLGSREDAEDAAQDAFWRAHRALDRYDEDASFRTWLMSILINRCRTTLLHRQRRTARVIVDDTAVARASTPSTASDTELRDAIDRALARLDAAQREAFLLKHVELLSYEEMSAATGLGISALKMRVQRACDRLQDLLEEDRHA